MRRLAFLVSVCIFVVGLAAAAQSVTCPIDGSGAYSTGKTRTDRATGKLLKEYKCSRHGHLFWVK